MLYLSVGFDVWGRKREGVTCVGQSRDWGSSCKKKAHREVGAEPRLMQSLHFRKWEAVFQQANCQTPHPQEPRQTKLPITPSLDATPSLLGPYCTVLGYPLATTVLVSITSCTSVVVSVLVVTLGIVHLFLFLVGENYPEFMCGCSDYIFVMSVALKHQQPVPFCCHQHLMSESKKLHFYLFLEVRSSCSVTWEKKCIFRGLSPPLCVTYAS